MENTYFIIEMIWGCYPLPRTERPQIFMMRNDGEETPPCLESTAFCYDEGVRLYTPTDQRGVHCI